MELDDIKPNKPVLMTAGLQRLFKAAGCSPTACHACGDKIMVGETFKLVTHNKAGTAETDEMCCHKCGVLELQARDSKKALEEKPAMRGFYTQSKPKNPYIMVDGQLRNNTGYSRPSKKV